MKELEYPFDARTIIAKRIKLKKLLMADGTTRLKKRIAILGGSTTNDIKQIMELFLLHNGIEPDFYESDYNQFYQDAMFPPQELVSFKPEIVYVCTTNRNILHYPALTDSREMVDQLLGNEFDRFVAVWDHLHEMFCCPIIQNNFEKPFYRTLGNRDASDFHGKTNYILRLNQRMYEYAQNHDGFYVCDIDYISSDYGLNDWFNLQSWYMYKYAMNPLAIPYLSFNVANIIKSIYGKNKKGFVLDLDNTLWGGIVGDDGVAHIKIGPEEPTGQAYLEFQRYLKELMQLGIILNINSKNDFENAMAGLRHSDGILKPEDMIIMKANWEPKDRNFAEIANELSLLPESLVFVDDNPAERQIVTEQLPGVSAPVIGTVQEYIKVIDRSGFFETTLISSDDKNRTQMYKENAARAQLQGKYQDYSEYLLSLDMHATIKRFEQVVIARIAQLTNKSNQFNLTTKRYTQEEIEFIANRNDYIPLYGRLVDRFGDNGVVTIVIGHQKDDVVEIELWLMSCRVLKRDMEYAMMDCFIAECKARGVRMVRGFYYPTAKNGMVKEFYAQFGFALASSDDNENSQWVLNVADYKEKNKVIAINDSEVSQ